MVSQFVSSHEVNLLGGIDFPFPEGTHAIGRLDNMSEGLLLLTTDKKVTSLLFESAVPHKRVYLAQVTYSVTPEMLSKIREGVSIRVGLEEYWLAKPLLADVVSRPPWLPPAPDVGDYAPHSWLSMTLTEGKFHQVRKMIKAVNRRCKRLIRVAIEDMSVEGLNPGEVREWDEREFFERLHIIRAS